MRARRGCVGGYRSEEAVFGGPMLGTAFPCLHGMRGSTGESGTRVLSEQ